MRYNILGRTGLFVSEMCLGTMTFGTNPGRYAAAGGVQQAEVDAIVARAFEAGINFFDTANVYAHGLSEEMLGRALKTNGIARDSVVIATKFEHAVGQGPNDSGASRYHIVNQVKASLKRLGTDHIDLYQLHGWDVATPLEETVRALDDLVRQGLVRYVGVSNWAAWQVARSLGVAERLNATRFQSVQAYYSLAARELEREIVPMVASEQVGLLVYSPLAGGYLSGKYRDGAVEGRRTSVEFPPVDYDKGQRVLAAMDGVAKSHNATMAAVALAWLLHQRSVTSVVLGVKRVQQLDENLAATDLRLTDEDLKILAEASEPSSEYPGWMFQYSSGPRQALLDTGVLSER